MLRRVFIVIAFALLAATAPSFATAPPARMDQVAQHFFDQKLFTGAVLVARGEKVLFSKAYGPASIEQNLPNATNTRFRIGSVTKQFTAAAILLLEERGQLKLTDPVKKHYPAAPAAWDRITLRHLLSHTAGLPNYTAFPDYEKTMAQPATVEQIILRFRDKPLEFAPGSRMNYSNSGYVLLGAIIEKAAGVSYEKFIDDNILKPLGLKDTGYEPAAPPIGPHAVGYQYKLKVVAPADAISMTLPYAGGALYSTVHDLHRWNQALYGNKLLAADTVKRMTTPVKDDYALGLESGHDDGAHAFRHSGGINGFNAELTYFPATHTTVVVLSNLNGPGANAVSDKLVELALGREVTLPAERPHVAVPREVLQKYAGSYRLRPDFNLPVRVEGDHLVTGGPNQPDLPLRARSPKVFFALGLEAELEFQLDSAGKVTGARLRQYGRDTLMPRVEASPVAN